MALIDMTKLRAILPAPAKRRLLKDFTSLGCVEITTADAAGSLQAEGLLQQVAPSPEVLQHKSDLTLALETLQRYAPGKKPFLAPKPQITEADLYESAVNKQAAELTAEILQINTSLNNLHNAQNQIQNRITFLTPWANSDLPLNLEGGKLHTIIRGTCPVSVDAQALMQEVAAQIPLAHLELVNRDKEQNYLLFVYHRDAEEAVAELFKRISFAKLSFKDDHGSGSECLKQAQEQLKEAQTQEGALIKRLEELAVQRPLLEQALDAQSLEALRETTSAQMVATRHTIYFEAWLPVYRQAEIEAILQQHECAYEFTAPTEDDDPPTLMESHKYFQPFSAITELYGLPAYGTVVDPNMFVGIFFFIFFGMMLGDAMYGLLLAGATYYVLRKTKPVGGMRNYLIVACSVGVASFISGALFSSWFGDLPEAIGRMVGANWSIPPILFAPLNDPISMLILAMGIGVVHLFVGMGLSAYRMIKEGHLFDAICDVGFWYLIIIGLIMALIPFFSGNGDATPGLIVAAVGAAGVLLTGGRKKKGLGKITGGLGALYGVTSYLSDILSYSRLMALALASGVVAQVVNTMGGLAGNGVVGWILFIVVFIGGHLFNFAIGLLGAFVHSCRLTYVEFFGKFFEAGGHEFVPLQNKTKYTQVIKEEN